MSTGHVVVDGAICKCKFGFTPDSLVVQTQNKAFINDGAASKKLIGNTMDLGMPFQAKTFGQCKLQPTSSSYLPCVPVITQWTNFYDKVILSNYGQILTEKSKATCAIAGSPCVKFTWHGQTVGVGSSEIAEADEEVQSQLNPLVNAKPQPEEKLEVGNANVKETIVEIINGYFYNENGVFEGKVNKKEGKGSKTDVHICSGKETKKDKNGKDIIVYTSSKTLKYDSKNITHYDFSYIAYIIKLEGDYRNVELKELKCIAFASKNRAKSKGITWKKLLSTSYSSVPNKKPLSETKKTTRDKFARQAIFSVLKGDTDITKGAEYWDGTDFLAWGNSEQNPYNKLGQNKFDEYKFIEIPKDIYDTYLAANGSSVRYGDKGNHPKKGDHGNHTHKTKTVKTKEKVLGKDGKPKLDKNKKFIYKTKQVPNKIKYKIPASDFTTKKYWESGNFYYDTGLKRTFGISGTISAGKSIFWKPTKTRLTSEKVVKK